MKYILFFFLGIFSACVEDQKPAETVEKKYFPNGRIMEIRHFRNGMKNGRQTAFWENGKKRFDFMAKNDAYEGALREWDTHGHLFHLAHFVNGQEEGVQKMWYENGTIRANYIIIKGRRFGLLGTKNCKNKLDSSLIEKP
ncbi:toxin-antitoxin system YwqK family antitoxin [Aquirufa sp. ROCK2-A2]